MKKYIKISNNADNVSRLSLEKLGLSTKRDNPDTIGKFGSGIKFAPIAALRNGWEWWFTGTDINGEYRLQYIVQKEDDIDCIWYDYGDVVKPSSFTVDAGTLSWTESFQIYREAVSNAMDGSKESGGTWSIEIVDEVVNEIGKFSVFISAAPELVDIYNNHDKYFSNNRVVEYESSSSSKALSKFDSNTRVYCHNVLVYENSEFDSIFDYRFDTIDLNEERTIKSEYSLNSMIEAMICRCSCEQTIKKIIDGATSNKSLFEFSGNNFNYANIYSFNPLWKQSFFDKYGESAVIIDQSTAQLNVDGAMKLRGIYPVLIKEDSAYRLLKAAGIPTAIDSLGESVKYKIEEDISEYPTLIKAIEIAARCEPGLQKFANSIAVFDPETSDILGLTINMKEKVEDRRILVSRTHAETGSLQNVIATLVHEFDHASTGIADSMDTNGRQFRELADRRIGNLVYDAFKNAIFTIKGSSVAFPVDSFSSVASMFEYCFEWSHILNRVIVTTDKISIIIDGDLNHGISGIQKAMFVPCEDQKYMKFGMISNVKSFEVIKN